MMILCLRKFIFLSFITGIILALYACRDNTENENAPPNILFILIDDMGWKDLGCYGNKFHETPNINKLAKEGMLFTDAYSSCPVCSPARAGIMTGKYPVSVNITDWIPGRQHNIGLEPDKKLKVPEFSHHLAHEETTIAEKLKQKGYKTVHIGKWHLGDSLFFPEHQGFDTNIAGCHMGMPPSYFYPFCKGDRRCLKSAQPYASEGDYLTDVLTREAVSYIGDHHEDPFFMYLSFYTVHIPIEGKEHLVQKYREKLSDTMEYEHTNPTYAAMVETLDRNIGRLFNVLDSLDIAQNTIIMFTSDNGGLVSPEGPKTPATTCMPLRAGKGYLYEGGIREPLLIKWPGVTKANSVCHEPVINIDFYPTLLNYLNIKDNESEGKDIMPLLQGSDEFSRGPVFWHYPHYSNQGGTPGSAIRLGDFKLIEFYEDGHYELYNLKKDIGEEKNLVIEMPGKMKKLKDMLHAWKDTMNVALPSPNPLYRE